MPTTRSKTGAESHAPSVKLIVSDEALMSLFNRATAAEQRPSNSNHTPEIELSSTEILLKYANGDHDRCSRPGCGRTITLEEALQRKKGCPDHCSSAKALAKADRNIEREERLERNTGGQRGIKKGHRKNSRVSSEDSDNSDDENQFKSEIGLKAALQRGKVKKATRVLLIDDVKQSMWNTYLCGEQITYDECFEVERSSGDTRTTIMAAAIVELRTALFHMWPRVREINDDNAIKIANTEASFVKVYACRCWAKPTPDYQGDPSEDCKGKLFVRVTEQGPTAYELPGSATSYFGGKKSLSI
ncbi:hypothetical protein FIBSPDRAFT_882337 [Athelia psychrophila]|uniref:Uncharacterized protein n=1 Tax=Athelia psychrophila TaxID=1759441 RepID=A0A166V8Q6_9AGAM|nr:hypothetical protein FIBSPDRAFT_882337 [Fibularhizoctonia sp. CBS 109695]